MKRLFLDTNILVDYIQNRQGGYDAKQLLMRGYNHEVKLCASILTFANIAYILKNKVDIYELMDTLTSFIEVLPMDGKQLERTLKIHVRDFEDMLQYQCALEGQCDSMITNNKKDFIGYCNLPLYTAAEFLNKYYM